jgi:hypothetical protein
MSPRPRLCSVSRNTTLDPDSISSEKSSCGQRAVTWRPMTGRGGGRRGRVVSRRLRRDRPDRAAVESDEVACRGDDYVIPNRRAGTVRRKERSDKVIWETIVDLGNRVGVKVTLHAPASVCGS